METKTIFAVKENQTVIEKLSQKRQDVLQEKYRQAEAFAKDQEEAAKMAREREAKLNGTLKPVIGED